MKDKGKTRAELIKELKFLREEREKGVFKDITKLKQVSSGVAISETKEYLENLIRYANAPIIVWDASLSITRFNRAFENLSGYDVSEVIGKKIDILFSKNKMESALEHIQKTSNGERWETIEIEIQRKDGEPRIVLWNSANILDTKGNNIIATIAQGQDITERKRTEKRINHINLILRAIRNVNQLIIGEKDREKLLKGACDNLVKTRGYHNAWIALLDKEGKLRTCAEAGLGKDFLPMIELLKRGKLTTCCQKALKQQEAVITENPVLACTECPLAQKYSGRAGFSIRLEHSGKVCGLMVVSIAADLAVDQEEQGLFKEVAGDIAFGLYNIDLDEERKQSEEALRESEAMFKGIFSQAPIGIELYDSKGNLISVNQECLNIFGVRNIEEIRGFKLFEDPNVSEEAKTQLRNGELVDYESEFDFEIVKKSKLYKTTRSGKCFLHVQITPYKISDRGNKRFVVHVQDITERKQTEEKLKKTMDAILDTISKIIEAKDPYTAGHEHRVSQLATAIAKELNLSQDKIEGIRIASLIHDIGKIGVPSEILSKPTKLTDVEHSLIRSHSQIGYNILETIDFSYPIASIVLQHHERLNGSGYPNNLKGDEILLEAKIICVADVVEAMSSHRPYRPSLGIDAALEEISKNKSILYDSGTVDICIRVIREKGFKFK